MSLYEWLYRLELEITLSRSSPNSVVLQGSMGLPGLSGNPGPLGRKVGLGTLLGLDCGPVSKLGLQAGAPWATCASWLQLHLLVISMLAGNERFLSPEDAGVWSSLAGCGSPVVNAV